MAQKQKGVADAMIEAPLLTENYVPKLTLCATSQGDFPRHIRG